jgi:hypothetical protein
VEVHDHYRFLWMKRVTGVDLAQHCQACLLGDWQRGVGPELSTLRLDLAPGVYYLCGVTEPYRWARNAHLAVEWSQGSRELHEVEGLTCRLANFRRIRFGEGDIAPDDPNRGRKEFRTCRNWQFAHHLQRRGVA